MTRNKGEHLDKHKTKIAIIEYILNNNKENNDPGIREPVIRQHLKKEYRITDITNIKRQLKGLIKSKNSLLLEKIPYKKAGEPNYWDVTKIKHLENIRDQFPLIQLNTYEKSVNIVLKKFNFPINSAREKKAFVQISLSASFFDKLLNTDIETLYARAPSLYHSEEALNIKNRIEDLIHYVYLESIKRVKEIPCMGPDADHKNTKNTVNSDYYQIFSQDALSRVISEEKFKKMLEDIKLSWEEKGYKKRIRNIIKELSIKLSHEILAIRLKELSEDPELNQELLNKMSVEIFKKLMVKIPVKLPNKIYSIIYDQYRYTSIIFEQIFQQFYDRDILDGNDTYMEREFMSKVKQINSTITDNEEQIEFRNEKLVDLYNDYYEKASNTAEIVHEFLSKVNDIFLTKIEDPEKIEAKIEKLDQLYNEYYEKCLGRHKISKI